ncbi:MAG: DNA recombination protein RmuC, partial [Bacteroidia bacterium]
MDITALLIGLVLGVLAAALWFIMQNRRKESESANLLQRLSILEEQRTALDNENRENRNRLQEMGAELAAARENVRNLNQRLAEKDAEVQKNEQQLREAFGKMAFENVQRQSQVLREQHTETLKGLLEPVRSKLTDFEKRVNDTHGESQKSVTELRAQIEMLTQLNRQVTEETHNLTRALKGDTKKQGNWGEVILEKVLERSGLVKGREYETQYQTANQAGDTIRPDAVVNLPDNKHILIDAKVSLTAYEAFTAADNDVERERQLKAHLLSMRSHAKLLAEKNYPSGQGLNAPEFVLMFVPIESSFALAVQGDSELFSYAWDLRVVIVSPSTLLATLRTIASIWKQENQNRNALEIAKKAGDLYDKFSAFTEDLLKVGRQLDTAKDTYSEAMKKLTDGRGNLVRRVEELRSMGAKAGKEINPALVARADEG